MTAAMSQCESSSLPLKLRPRSTICHFCCFSAVEDADDYGDMHDQPTTFRRCRWMLASHLPEMRDRCLRLISRSQRKGGNSQAEFNYDPLSYTLNFEDEWSRKEDEQFPLHNFLARMPATPERPAPIKCAV
ncbi:hypothetical protein SAY87_014936 [Trapa incisa]|uniref:Uncharacterized protein n=1 Tax=Trapa incisa TaxID=236973 RepID=A0AAN7GY46_9MYRT|nr:hypothetical protein SAY87_014936 [Trapa incisa]